MFVLVKPWLLPRRILGITIWPVILLKHKELLENQVLLNHERIHLRQQIQMLILPFYIWYGMEYVVRLIQFRNSNKAYRNLSMEREAYTNESNLDYLKTHGFWSFLKYL